MILRWTSCLCEGKMNLRSKLLLSSLAALLTYNPISAEPITSKKNSGESVLEQAVNDETREIGKTIAHGLKQVEWGRDAEGYRNAYYTFLEAYSASSKKISKTNEDIYRGLAIISLMHASKVLNEAGNNIVEGRQLGHASRVNNLKMALKHYGDVLILRAQLDGKDKPLRIIYTPELGFMRVASEKFIREKLSQTYEELIERVSGREKSGYQNALNANKLRSAELNTLRPYK